MAKVKNAKKFSINKIAFVPVLILVVIFLGVWSMKSFNNARPLDNFVVSSISQNIQNKEIRNLYMIVLNKLNSEFNANNQDVLDFNLVNSSFVWTNANGFNNVMQDYQGISVLNSNSVGVKIGKILEGQGYVRNNSTRTDITQYKKGNIKCSYPSIDDVNRYCYTDKPIDETTLTCTDAPEIATDPIRIQLGLTDEYVTDTKVGKFHELSINGVGGGCTGGYPGIAKEVNGKLVMISYGQDYPLCQTLIDEQVPKGIHAMGGKCHDAKDKLINW